MRWTCTLLVLATLVARPAAAEPKPEISTARRAGAIAAAIFPGVVVRGLGSYLVGEKRAAKRLLYSAAAGGALMATGGAFVGATGGNPYVVWPQVPLLLVGTGAFVSSWFTDIYVAAGGGEIDAHPRALPPFSVEASMSWQHDAYRERALAGAAGRFEVGRVGLAASGLFHTGGDAALVDLDAHVRILGAPATGEVITSGSRLYARIGGRWYREKPDDLTQFVAEVEVSGRYDLASLDPALGPTFFEAATGIGALRATYASTTHDWGSELLGGFGWGVYVGTRGEVKAFYEHRRDGLVGGIAAYRAAGFVGSVGGIVDLRVAGPWGVRAELDIGNAWLSTLALVYRGGPP
ncbi:MAG: hypothetical protein HOV81_15975 [Kofleriaceae bacterium]|nr:hypothetical protein [Kofleriaceae bacterium]